MTIQKLSEGCRIQCTYCHQAHEAVRTYTSKTEAVQQMLYVYCTKPKPAMYYVGRIGGLSNRGPIVQQGTP